MSKKRISKWRKRVEELLRRYPQMQDDQDLLIGSILYDQMALYNAHYPEHAVLSAKDFIKWFTGLKPGSRKYVPKLESITRARRMVQEEIPELRGKTRAYRKQVAEPQTREEVREIKKNRNLPGKNKPQGTLF